jgi:hypothetical protein
LSSLKDIEKILILMNRFGCTKLSTTDLILEIPVPKRPISDEMGAISDQELTEVQTRMKDLDAKSGILGSSQLLSELQPSQQSLSPPFLNTDSLDTEEQSPETSGSIGSLADEDELLFYHEQFYNDTDI